MTCVVILQLRLPINSTQCNNWLSFLDVSPHVRSPPLHRVLTSKCTPNQNQAWKILFYLLSTTSATFHRWKCPGLVSKTSPPKKTYRVENYPLSSTVWQTESSTYQIGIQENRFPLKEIYEVKIRMWKMIGRRCTTLHIELFSVLKNDYLTL